MNTQNYGKSKIVSSHAQRQNMYIYNVWKVVLIFFLKKRRVQINKAEKKLDEETHCVFHSMYRRKYCRYTVYTDLSPLSINIIKILILDFQREKNSIFYHSSNQFER